MKTIRHKWVKTGFQRWICQKCKVEKYRYHKVTYFEKYFTTTYDPGCILMNEKPFKIELS